MTEDNSLNSFIKDWNINRLDGIAKHKSGIGFKYIANGENGKPRVEILNLPQWFQSEMKQGKSLEECNENLRNLNNQFVLIQEDILVRSKQNSDVQFPIISRGGYER